jgi:hypothetical protein
MQVTDGEGAASLGWLAAYLFRTADERSLIEAGPRRLVEGLLQGTELEECTIRTLWRALMGHPMTTEEARRSLEPLRLSFAASGHDLRALVVELVDSDAWRCID